MKVPLNLILTPDEIDLVAEREKTLSEAIMEAYNETYNEWFHIYPCCTEIKDYLIFGLNVSSRNIRENRDCFSYENPRKYKDEVIDWENSYFKFNRQKINVDDILNTFVTVDYPVEKQIQEMVANQIHMMLPSITDVPQVYLILDDCTSCS